MQNKPVVSTVGMISGNKDKCLQAPYAKAKGTTPTRNHGDCRHAFTVDYKNYIIYDDPYNEIFNSNSKK